MTKPNNNYAAPHTPIASVKRPRSSLDRSMLSPAKGSASSLPSSPLNNGNNLPPSTPSTIKEGIDEDNRDRLPMSPMHPARPLVIREDEPAVQEACTAAEALAAEGDPNNSGGSWVGRQVDALFSPVLNFLNGEEHEEHEAHSGEEGHGHGHTGANKHPHDVPMDDTSTTAVDVDVDIHTPPKIESDTSNTTSLETASHEEEDEEEEEQVQVEPEPEQEDEEEEEPVIEDDNSSQGSLDEDEFNPYIFIKSLPVYDLVAPLRPPIALPPKRKDAPPISLVLDLDETLVHCTVEPVDDADLVFPVVFHGMTYQVHVRLRPHLFQFLEKIKGNYEVTVFTASQKVYANELLDLIDPDGKYIQHRMFRDSCLAVEGNFLKDLNVLGRDLSKTVLVDNSPHAFGYQVDNGIPIESWFDDPNDTELLKLERFLRTLHHAPDVRRVVRQKFQTHRLIAEA